MRRPGHLLDALRRRALLVAGTTFVVLVLAGIAGILLPASYTSTATVLVAPLTGNPFAPDGRSGDLLNLETEAQLIDTDAVAAGAAKTLKTTTPPEELRAGLQVEVTGNTQVVGISYAARTASGAQRNAQAFAEAYLAYRTQRAKVLVAGDVGRLQNQVKATQTQLAQARRDEDSETVTSLSATVVRLQSEIADKQGTELDPGQIITDATYPEAPRLPFPLFLLAGLVAGLGAGIALALWRESRDDRVRDDEEVEHLGAVVLGELSERTGWSSRTFEQISEEHRRLRSSFLSVVPQMPTIVLFARGEASDRAPEVVAPLAVALSRSDVSVVVVDAAVTDWLEQELSPGQGSGLAEILVTNAVPESALVRLDPNLTVLPRGRWSPTATEHLGSVRMRRALQTLRQAFDVVLVSGPNLQSADGQTLLRMADAVVVEGSVGVMTRSDLTGATERSRAAGAELLGVVLSRPERSRRRNGEHLTRPVHPDAAPAAATWSEEEPAPSPAPSAGRAVRTPPDRPRPTSSAIRMPRREAFADPASPGRRKASDPHQPVRRRNPPGPSRPAPASSPAEPLPSEPAAVAPAEVEPVEPAAVDAAAVEPVEPAAVDTVVVEPVAVEPDAPRAAAPFAAPSFAELRASLRDGRAPRKTPVEPAEAADTDDDERDQELFTWRPERIPMPPADPEDEAPGTPASITTPEVPVKAGTPKVAEDRPVTPKSPLSRPIAPLRTGTPPRPVSEPPAAPTPSAGADVPTAEPARSDGHLRPGAKRPFRPPTPAAGIPSGGRPGRNITPYPVTTGSDPDGVAEDESEDEAPPPDIDSLLPRADGRPERAKGQGPGHDRSVGGKPGRSGSALGGLLGARRPRSRR